MDFFHTYVSAKAIERALRVLHSQWLSEGPIVQEFEQALANLGLVNPLTVNSGTAALHLALTVAGIKPGDEVILPAQTFVATGLVVLMVGATPVFADIQYETGNISPSSILEKITPRTKAIICVHWAGYPCDLDEITEIADKHDLIVIEDAAHAFGATYKGKLVGSVSRFTAFSFQATKRITTGDGGLLCCQYPDDFEEARLRRWFGIDRLKSSPSVLGERQYDIKKLGYKYHMNDLAAAIGIGNLADFPIIQSRIREIAKTYRSMLTNVPGLKMLEYKNDRESAYWFFPILVERRIDFIKKLRSCGIPCSVVHQRIDRNTIFGGLRHDLPNQEKFDVHHVGLPIHVGLTDEDINRIIRAVRSGW